MKRTVGTLFNYFFTERKNNFSFKTFEILRIQLRSDNVTPSLKVHVLLLHVLELGISFLVSMKPRLSLQIQ